MRSSLSIALVALAGLVMLACGGSSSDGPSKGGGGTAGTGGVVLNCADLNNPPPDCGKTCTSDSQCVSSFCQNSTQCVANCTATQGCGEGSSCNTTRGICVPDVGTGGTGGTGNVIGCQSVEVTPSRSIPNIMFLVDQSGSMDTNDFGPMNLNRWTAAHAAITSIASDPLDDIVRFGLTTYTSRNGDDNGPCPRLPVAGDPLAGSPRVDFALGAGSDIGNTGVYPSSYPDDAGEDTPTGDSIDALVGLVSASPPPNDGPTIIVLATDGEPDSCECPDSGHPGCAAADPPRDEAVDASAAAHAQGIDVFVLWVGELNSSSTRDHLQEVANAGVEGTGEVWVGDDPASLSNAFQSIISESISCEIEIDKPFNEDTLDEACEEGDVRLNGTPLSCPSDWQVKDEAPYKTIELLGAACDTLKSGQVTFTAVFPCGTIIVE